MFQYSKYLCPVSRVKPSNIARMKVSVCLLPLLFCQKESFCLGTYPFSDPWRNCRRKQNQAAVASLVWIRSFDEDRNISCCSVHQKFGGILGVIEDQVVAHSTSAGRNISGNKRIFHFHLMFFCCDAKLPPIFFLKVYPACHLNKGSEFGPFNGSVVDDFFLVFGVLPN
jgi:hypothetical protein